VAKVVAANVGKTGGRADSLPSPLDVMAWLLATLLAGCRAGNDVPADARKLVQDLQRWRIEYDRPPYRVH
jgi:hypothetical protein